VRNVQEQVAPIPALDRADEIVLATLLSLLAFLALRERLGSGAMPRRARGGKSMAAPSGVSGLSLDQSTSRVFSI